MSPSTLCNYFDIKCLYKWDNEIGVQSVQDSTDGNMGG